MSKYQAIMIVPNFGFAGEPLFFSRGVDDIECSKIVLFLMQEAGLTDPRLVDHLLLLENGSEVPILINHWSKDQCVYAYDMAIDQLEEKTDPWVETWEDLDPTLGE